MSDPVAALTIPTDEMITFLVGLLNTPSPTGYYREAIEYVERALSTLPSINLSRTNKGALLATIAGRSDAAPRALTAHVDTLGLMVKEIKGDGRLKLTQIGGYAWNEIELEGVTVRTFDDRRYRGTVMPVNAGGHVNHKLSEQPRNADTMEVRLDERTSSADQTSALGIEVGDFVFLDPRIELSTSGFVRSRHLDDKAGVAAIYGALLALSRSRLQLAQQTTVLISNYEEVGHGGADSLPDKLAEYVVVDMGALGEGQNGDEFSVSICAKDSTGPYHFELTGKLRKLAAAFEIPYKVDIYPYYGSDGSMYWGAGGKAQVGLIGPGIDASHAYERTHTETIAHTAHLIARYLLDG